MFERAPSTSESRGLNSKASRVIQGITGSRAYNIVLTRRSLEAIERSGAKLPDSCNLKLTKSMRYVKGAKAPSPGQPPNEWAKTVNRGLLSGALATAARDLHPDRITFHYESPLRGINLAKQTVEVSTRAVDGNDTKCVSFDLLVGADGASSQVRSIMAEQVPGFSFTQLQDDMEYKPFRMPSLSHSNPDWTSTMTVMLDQPRDASIIFPPSAPPALEDASGPDDPRPGAVYILPKGVHDSLKTAEKYEAQFRESFPWLKEDQYSQVAQQLAASPVSSGGVNTRCSQLHGPNVVLIGDAAHSMWPSLGQGANAALESAGVLDRALEACDGDNSSVPETFNKLRHEDALAAVELTQRGFGGKNTRTVYFGLFMFKFLAQLVLSKILPFIPRPALTTLNDTLASYSEILKSSERHSRVADITLAVIGASLIAALFFAIKALLCL